LGGLFVQSTNIIFFVFSDNKFCHNYYYFNINIKEPPLFPKKFPENFIDGINPPKTPVKVSYRGGYGRGDPHIGGYAILPPEGIMWIT
jgi:hypothetical protein